MKAATIMDLKHGLMADFSDEEYPCQVYGVIGGRGIDGISLPHMGTAYGFCMSGELDVVGAGHGGSFITHVRQMEYFSAPGKTGLKVFASKDGCGFFAYRLNFMGLRHLGGPVESVGRLRYIDGCSDVGVNRRGGDCRSDLHRCRSRVGSRTVARLLARGARVLRLLGRCIDHGPRRHCGVDQRGQHGRGG